MGPAETEVSSPVYNLRRPVKTALHQSIIDGRIHQMRLLVQSAGSNVNAKDMFGRTPLMLTCLLDNEDYGLKMFRILVKADASLNLTDNMKRTALHYACMKGRAELVQRLIDDDRVDLSLADNDGNTALVHACLSGKPHIVDRLLDAMVRYGMNVDRRNTLGYTAFLIACKFGHYVSAHLVLTRGNAQPDLRDGERHLTALEWLQESSDMRRVFLPSRSQTMLEIPQQMVSFSRERTMYTERENQLEFDSKRQAPVSAPNPLGRSIGSALQLPNIFKGFHVDRKWETHLQGRNARDLLTHEIQQVLANRKSALRRQNRRSTIVGGYRSASTIATRQAAPSTAKLRGVQSRGSTAVADVSEEGAGAWRSTRGRRELRMLFRIYADQFEHHKLALNINTNGKSRESSHHHVHFENATPESNSAAGNDVINANSLPVETAITA